MKFPVFASVIILSLTLMITLKLLQKKERNQTKKFLEREALANTTRKQPLDSLDYIQIPEMVFQLYSDSSITEVQGSLYTLNQLKESLIVNLTGITNTELKLSYGAANLETLSQYDQNYTAMARCIQVLAEYSFGEGQSEHATQLLEFLISTHCDMIGTYRLLGNIYKETNNYAKLDYLVSVATTLPGLTRDPILKMLQSLRPSDTLDEESILDILE